MGEVDEVSAARALGAALRHRRMAKGLSLRALAKEIGLSAHGTLVDYEHGRRIPPEDLLVSCEKVLDVDDGSLRRLRLDALAERAGDQAAALLTAPAPAPAPEPVAAAARPLWRRWRFLVPVLVVVLIAAVGGVMLTRPGSKDGPPSGADVVRFGFENPSENWTLLWGAQKARAEVTEDRHYEGSHSFQVTMAGPSMNGPGPSYGYVAFGTTHGLESLHAGMRVTMHLWTSYPKDGFQFMVYDGNSHKVNAPETPRDGTEIHAAPGPDGWAAVTWTVPDVPLVGAIIVQPYQRDDTPRVIAVDAVSW